eukprot:5607717-Pyramimonas_sp.AAC.1
MRTAGSAGARHWLQHQFTATMEVSSGSRCGARRPRWISSLDGARVTRSFSSCYLCTHEGYVELELRQL